jgi:hypothetical protein
MRRALATTALAAGLALGGAPLLAPAALAAPLPPETGTTQEAETDRDEPAAQDGNDDTGKWGLAGLTGLFGLFGYRKYRDVRAARAAQSGGTGPARSTGPIGDVDGDGSGSRKV